MRKTSALLLLMAWSAGGLAAGPAPVWPDVTQTAKPWTRWWWPGSAVERAELSRGSSKRSRPPVSAASRSRRSTARAASKTARRIPVAALGRNARAHRARSQAARAGRRHGHRHGLALRRSVGQRRAGLEHGRAREWPSRGQADGHEGEARGARRRGPGARSVSRRTRSPLSRALHARFAPLPRVAVRGQFHDSFEYYNVELDAAVARPSSAAERL